GRGQRGEGGRGSVGEGGEHRRDSVRGAFRATFRPRSPRRKGYAVQPMHRARRTTSVAPMQAFRDAASITERQREIIELIAQGLSNDEMSQELGISPRTAKAHCDVLRQKLGVPRRRQIPLAYRLLTGDDPLARSLELARADNGG